MGKYTKTKPKTSTEVSLIAIPSLTGVLTRAKTLALTKSVGSYIQLRNRRLVKPNLLKKQNEKKLVRNWSTLKGDSVKCGEKLGDKKEEICDDDEEEGSFGENVLEIEGTERTTRETTPCSLIRDPEAIKIPGSSTKSKRPTEKKYREQDTTPRPILSTSDMDEFFTGPEKQQQRLFIEKYNFDPVNDKPLPGRYEWVKLDSTKKS